MTILGGYAADGGEPGALTNTPTILTRTGGTARILYISGVTSGLPSRGATSIARLARDYLSPPAAT